MFFRSKQSGVDPEERSLLHGEEEYLDSDQLDESVSKTTKHYQTASSSILSSSGSIYKESPAVSSSDLDMQGKLVANAADELTAKVQHPLHHQILSCLMYTFFSVSMVLANKAISQTLSPSVRSHIPQMSVILYQNMLAVFLVQSAKACRLIDYPNFQLSVAYSWLPMNALFVGMLCSGFMSLVYVSVPMVQTFKNLTNLVTVAGDWLIFNEQVSALSLLAVLIMTIGAIFAGVNDIDFHWVGYFWMISNCIMTASYTLYMRYASRNIKIPKMGMVFYNNLLSVIFLVPLIHHFNEYEDLRNPDVMTTKFIIVNTLAGLLGAGLNFASLYCVGSTSATTYAIVGTLNKIPVTILGYFLFDAHITDEGLMFIGFATLGGLLYGYAKLPKDKVER